MSLFGTDGIRGEANREPLTPETLARIGRALGATLLEEGAPPRVLVGRDTRRSGSKVGGAVVAGLLSAGVAATSAATGFPCRVIRMDSPCSASRTHTERWALAWAIDMFLIIPPSFYL